jgi:UDP-3-O-[3-hydroxymyristoyl] N-acetylglucosamine deacetylase
VFTVNPALETIVRKQRTLRDFVSFSGIGIHTGKEVRLRFCPANEGTGIIFKRMDLASKPVVPATVEYVQDTSRSTTIGIKDIRIHTVEHVLSAIRAYNIDNLCIEITSIEPPVGNGSSDIFVEMIDKVGVCEQEHTVPIVKIQHPVYWSEGDIHLVALPYAGYRISYTLSYPESSLLRGQFYSVLVNEENFKKEIAPCRTFSLYKEISILIDKGLIKGGSLDNAVIIKDDVIFSKGGLFFPDEMARHKILDLIGDLSLIGFNFHAHIIAIRSGHASNFAFAQQLLKHITMENH